MFSFSKLKKYICLSELFSGPNRPINNDNQRLFFLANLAIVDFVTIDCNPTAENIIRFIKPDFYIKGRDYYLYNRKDDYSKNLKKE